MIKLEKVVFVISGKANGAKWFNMNGARTITNLLLPEQTINAKFLEEKYLSKTLLEKIAGAKPKILIGQDNGILTVAREKVSPRSDGPMMTQTKLGWIIHGLLAVSRKEDHELLHSSQHFTVGRR
jgi:hypothetical protein